MKILIIDSHKGSKTAIPQNLHWLNSAILRDHLQSLGHNVTLIWSYPSVNEELDTGFDVIVYVHASLYAFIDYEWITHNPDARIVYITNEYNLGEPLSLWKSVRNGRKYDVIANHSPEISKIVRKYVNDWHFVNINALIAVDTPVDGSHENGIVYYGSYRKGREPYFKQYLTDPVVLSTHSKNHQKFQELGVTSKFAPRLRWDRGTLAEYKLSLYIEDTVTHNNYNCLANRFYEALNHGVVPIIASSCKNTAEKSGYIFPETVFVDTLEGIDVDAFYSEHAPLLSQWRMQALEERKTALDAITRIVLG